MISPSRILIVLLALCCLAPAWCQDEFVPDKGQTAGETKQDDPQKELKDKIKKYDEFVKEATKLSGPFVLYTKTKEGKTELYIELGPEHLGKVFFLQSELQSGANADGLQAGESGSLDLAVAAYRFQRVDDKVRIMTPNLGWRWSDDNVWAPSSRRSFPEGLVDTLKVEVENPETKRLVIKATGLFDGGLIDLNDRINEVLGKTYQYDRDNSGISEVKAFPENIVIRTKNFYNSSGGGGGEALADIIAALTGKSQRSHLATDKSLPLNVTYLLYPKVDTGYEPRLADPRVGYFSQDYFDTTQPLLQDKIVRQILRWDIRKKDRTAAVSPPERPIVFWIDESVPQQYHKAISDGILRWNAAFEKIGISGAIQVKDKPKDADWDHADMRYNVVRMIRSEGDAYAVAHPRWDPYTGEVLNASISIDASMLFEVAQEYAWIAAPAVGSYETDLAKVLHRESPRRTTLFADPMSCRYGSMKAESASFGMDALKLLHPMLIIDRKKYLDQFLADVVCHEMGHVLGLRHNFVASAYLSPEQLANPQVTAKLGLAASVMDYTPVNIFAVANGAGDYYSRTIGVCDYFAIEYGYKDIAGGFAQEAAALRKIASRASLPGLRFMTDENADSFDPYVVRFDNSLTPLANANKEVSVAKLLLSKADANYPKPGRPFSDLTRVVNLAIRQTLQQSAAAARFVGGTRGNRNFAGDPKMKATLAPVEPADQRAALKMIAANLFSEYSFDLSPRMLSNLAGDPNSEVYDPAEIKDVISGAQRAVLSMLLSADTVSRVANNSFKWGARKDKFTLAELYKSLTASIYAEIGTGRSIGVLRRNLQRFMTDALIAQAGSRAGAIDSDARMLAGYHLRALSGRLQKAASKDEMTRIHLNDLAESVKKALSANPYGG